ncbi:polysaccharide biosynthesis protein [Fictibacillus sp. 5RED26]|uniref:oligosaccharide flippase family protein n=1 Tax=Fictibacillus sp. 5RED26 TaxID=2745876 RepID=UPI0018CD2A15|nr:oligosaccharide flippase family protein [Fictibacillus sp. 5RED26]MBH0156828.1 polysaccharide biosynthesis protein [Fictibacillus sp. 5RED26]
MLLKHTFIYFLSRGLPGLVNFAAIALYTRLLSPSEYGKYALVLSAVGFASTGIFHWLRLGLLRFAPKYTEQENLFLSSISAAFLSLVGFSLILFTGPFFYFARTDEWQALWLIGLGLLLVQNLFDMATEYLRSKLSSLLYGIITLVKTVLSLGISFLLIKWGLEASSILWGLIIGMIVPLVYLLPRYLKKIRLHHIDWDLVKEVFRYGMPLVATLSMNYIIFSSDRFIIGYLLGTKSTGLYSVGYDLAKQILVLLMMIVNLAAYPLVIKALETEGVKAAQKQLDQNTILLFFIGLPATAGLILLSPDITSVFFGTSFREAGGIIFSLICVAVFIQSIKTYYFDLAFELGKKTLFQIWPVLIAGVINIILNFLLIPQFGIKGSAYASIIAYIVAIMMSWSIGKKAFPLTFPGRNVTKLFIATFGMALCLYPLYNVNGVLWMFFKVGIGGIVYGLLVYVLNVANCRSLLPKAYNKFIKKRG